MSLAKNLHLLLDHIRIVAEHAGRNPSEIALVAVSKERSLEEIKEAYFAGCRDFGENRVQEALDKMEEAPRDIRWHYIGKLQSKKVNRVIGRFALIHSVDTLPLAQKISQASKTPTKILLEANTLGEETKSGLSPNQWEEAFPDLLELPGIQVEGLMTLAPLTEDEGRIRQCFARLRQLRDTLQEMSGEALPTLSMGMSNDYPIAIQEGATLLRIGSALFNPQQV